MDRRERGVRNHALEHFDGVVAHHPHISQVFRGYAVQQAADAGAMHFNRDEVGVGPRLGDRHRGFAHAGADLEHERRLPPKNFYWIQFRLGERQAVLRIELI
jgi:hypothetical protein